MAHEVKKHRPPIVVNQCISAFFVLCFLCSQSCAPHYERSREIKNVRIYAVRINIETIRPVSPDRFPTAFGDSTFTIDIDNSILFDEVSRFLCEKKNGEKLPIDFDTRILCVVSYKGNKLADTISIGGHWGVYYQDLIYPMDIGLLQTISRFLPDNHKATIDGEIKRRKELNLLED